MDTTNKLTDLHPTMKDQAAVFELQILKYIPASTFL
jgi:hypothetical protein